MIKTKKELMAKYPVGTIISTSTGITGKVAGYVRGDKRSWSLDVDTEKEVAIVPLNNEEVVISIITVESEEDMLESVKQNSVAYDTKKQKQKKPRKNQKATEIVDAMLEIDSTTQEAAVERPKEEQVSIATQIRTLLSTGMSRSEVAKQLGVGYRYVYAIEHKVLKRELP